ncbi:MAG TPA: hypothetical protein VKV24_03465 [Casimicrobiaceae bacterium]|nr:hypothetical protein [Casimicrobiaceae bacterium]
MKRGRRKRGFDLGVAADVSTDDTSMNARLPRGNRCQRMKLPHERDESTHETGEPNPVTAQAARDLAEGKRDTDCYDATASRYDRKEKR